MLVPVLRVLRQLPCMKHLHFMLICLSLVQFGCGYTIPKPANASDSPIPQRDTIDADSPIELSDSLLFGEWAGTGRCYDHASRTDENYWITFGSDYSWMLKTNQSTVQGVWRSSMVQGNYQIDIMTGDSWTWNGPCGLSKQDDALILSVDRAWQVHCTLTLVRAVANRTDNQ